MASSKVELSDLGNNDADNSQYQPPVIKMNAASEAASISANDASNSNVFKLKLGDAKASPKSHKNPQKPEIKKQDQEVKLTANESQKVTSKPNFGGKKNDANKSGKKPAAFKRKESHVISSYDEMKKAMSTMKHFAPLLGTASSISDTPEDIGRTTKMLVDDTQNFANYLCELAGMDPMDSEVKWLRAEAMGIAAYQVSSQAKRSMAGMNGGLDELKAAAKVISELPVMDAENYPYSKMSLTIRLNMSVMKSVMPLARELASAECVLAGRDMIPGFEFDTPAILTHAQKVMMGKVNDVVNKADIKVNDENTKMTLYQGLLNHASSLYVNSAIFHIDRMIDEVELTPMTKKKDVAILDIESIDKKFNINFDVLMSITLNAQQDYLAAFTESTLANSKQSTPSKRNRNDLSGF